MPKKGEFIGVQRIMQTGNSYSNLTGLEVLRFSGHSVENLGLMVSDFKGSGVAESWDYTGLISGDPLRTVELKAAVNGKPVSLL